MRHVCRLKEISYSEKLVAAELGPGSACQIEVVLLFLGLGNALRLHRVFENRRICFLKENYQKLINSTGDDG